MEEDGSQNYLQPEKEKQMSKRVQKNSFIPDIPKDRLDKPSLRVDALPGETERQYWQRAPKIDVHKIEAESQRWFRAGLRNLGRSFDKRKKRKTKLK